MAEKRKIVVSFVEAGMGHIVSSRAISDALNSLNDGSYEVNDVYFFQQQNNKKMAAYEEGLVQQTKYSNKVKGWGNVWFMAMQIGNDPQKLLHDLHEVLFKPIKNLAFQLFDELDCDVFVSTHHATTHFACEYKAEHPESRMKVVTYDPDNNVHGWWDIRTDLFITNNEAASQYAISQMGFVPTNVKTVFFPARNDIKNACGTREEYRKQLGIEKDAFTVVLADGAYASAKMHSFTKELLKSEKKMTVLAIAGRNDRVKKDLDDKIEEGLVPPNITLKNYGFMPNAYELYAAADIFVTKAGPNAICDSMYMHTPVIINYMATPIEEYTAKLYTKIYKCGIILRTKKRARERIEKWIDNPAELNKYKANTQVFDKEKSGEKDIAKIIIQGNY